MKALAKLSLVCLLVSSTSFAMQPPPAQPLTPVVPQTVDWSHYAPVTKPCCCVTCCPTCLKCFCGFLSCCVSATDTYGGLVIKLAEVALPFPQAQQILGTINQIYTTAKPMLVPLAAACKDAAVKLPAEYIAALKAQGIDISQYVNPDGSPKPEFAAVVNAALTVTPSAPTRGTEPRVTARLLNAAQLHDAFVEAGMLYQPTE